MAVETDLFQREGIAAGTQSFFIILDQAIAIGCASVEFTLFF